MKDFEYAAPTTLAEATQRLAQANGGGRVLAGGTDIIVQLRENMKTADVVVDVKRIPALMEYSFSPAAGLRLGASVPCSTIYEDPALVAAYPALADSARIIGGRQIQSRASVGGNLCNSSPAGDTIPSLIALDARAEITGPNGSRVVPVAQFCTAPGKNVLQPGELLVALVFPAPGAREGSAYERFIPRNEMDIAVVGIGAWVRLSADGSTIEAARIGVGAAAPTPRFAQEASDRLAGKPAIEATFEEAGELARAVASPIDDMRGTAEFRTHLVGVLTKRTLAKAVERARTV
ncbi:MAG: xanthine dehydrogenase family protein subunit M [Isosphaeraceae bacterium]|nr:xanthine dehydrogenase family protein subunit M [Isosphaeraceae bacterium]